MNRQVILFLLAAFLMVSVSACGGSSNPTVPDDRPQDDRIISYLPDEYCGDATEVCLIAGQIYDAGEVIITNDENYLYVEIILYDGWELLDSHVAVADSLDGIPQTESGNPKVGQFPYDINSFIPLGDWECETELYVAVHAVVRGPNEDGEIEEQTAWGCGYPFPGDQWATYSMHTVQCCGEEEEKEIPDLPVEPVCGKVSKHWGYHSYFNTMLTDAPSGFEWLLDGWDGNGYWLGWCVDLETKVYPNSLYCQIMLYSSLEPDTWPNNDPRFDIDWERINYILNHKQGTKEDVQDAIWYFSDGEDPPEGPAQDMVDDALANGEGFFPDEGDWFAVISYAGRCVQLTFFEVDP